MRATLNLPPSVRLIEAGLEGLVQVNRVLIETGVVPPSPLDAGVRYKRERSGLEEWDNAVTCIKRKWCDCEDLNSWECARINIEEDEWAVCTLIQTGPKLFHCVIRMSDGSLRDICPDLGMKVPGTNLEGIPWVETRAENILGGSRSSRRRALRAMAKFNPLLRHGKGGYRPKPSSSSRPGSGVPYQPKPSGRTQSIREPETMPPSAPTATEMVSPTSASNPAAPSAMPMPMMDEDAPDMPIDEGEEFVEEMEEGEDEEGGEDE